MVNIQCKKTIGTSNVYKKLIVPNTIHRIYIIYRTLRLDVWYGFKNIVLINTHMRSTWCIASSALLSYRSN